MTLIGQANAALARYDGMLQSIVSPSVLLSPLTVQEAVLSSRIEGTQASMEEVLQFEADSQEPIDPSRRADIQEILNYRRAMAQAVAGLETRPFSLNLLKSLHATLLDSVRGRDRSPGRFRRVQNYVAPPGEPIERATYVPPVWEQVEPAMENWESYLHADERDPLVQLAIAKAQFELIHPFMDGNGRLGRMLVPIFLFEKRLLSSPMFYLSAYIEEHRDVYYHRLQAISQEGDWNGWVTFFLTALVEQARSNLIKTHRIIALYERMKAEVPKATRSQYAIQALDALFDRPIFQSADFVTRSGIPKDSTLRILRQLKEIGIVRDMRPQRGRRGAVMIFAELLQIVEE
ncbi:Fic family protein [Chloroflexota bacterium]